MNEQEKFFRDLLLQVQVTKDEVDDARVSIKIAAAKLAIIEHKVKGFLEEIESAAA